MLSVQFVINTGVHISNMADEMFKKRFQGLHDLLERQMATYKEEDKALRVSFLCK